MPLPRYVNWCFTYNNYTESGIESLKTFEHIKYCIFGKEIGESGTPHLQGYFELYNKKSIAGLKESLIAHSEELNFHFESRKSNQEKAIDYCKKGEQSHEDWKKYGIDGETYGLNADVTEWGVKARPGTRNDLDAARQCVEDNGMREVSARFGIQGIQVARHYLTYCERTRELEFNPLVIYIYGEPGSGKSQLARELVKDLDTYWWRPALFEKWWDGYDQHSCVVLDDIRLSHVSEALMLALLDKYDCAVQVKGSTRQMLANMFIITTLLPPEKFWNSHEVVTQLLRRISITVKVSPDHSHHVEKVNENLESTLKGFKIENEFLKKLIHGSRSGGNTVPPTSSPLSDEFIEKCLEIEDIFDDDKNIENWENNDNILESDDESKRNYIFDNLSESDLPEMIKLDASQIFENIDEDWENEWV